MKLIKTKSFDLALYTQGKENAEKLALALPGRLDTKDYSHIKSHVEYLADRGYLAVSFDPPGTWESPGDIKLYTVTNYLEAVNELIEYFDNRPTFLVGHSLGGSIAMLAAIKNPRVTHFCSVMGSYSFAPNVYSGYPDEAWGIKGYKISRRDLPNPSKGQVKIFKLPHAFFEDQTQYDAIDGLRACTKPKLFILGTRDITFKPKIVKTAYEVASQPKLLFSIDSDHDYRFHPDLINEVNICIGRFLDRYEL